MPVEPEDRELLLARLPTLVALRDADPAELLTQRGQDRALQSTELSKMAADPANHALVKRAQAVVARLVANPATALTDGDRADLEAISLLVTRPSLFVREGRVGAAPAEWPAVDKKGADIARQIPCVGRLERAGMPCGTGFLVAPGRVLTNNHVLWCLVRRAAEEFLPLETYAVDPALFAKRIKEADAAWVVDSSKAPVLEFRGEDGRIESSQVQVTGIIDHHDTLDVAILQVGSAAGAGIAPLTRSAEPVAPGRSVYVIGYPLVSKGHPYDTADLVRIFGPTSAWTTKKRLAPGLVRSCSDTRLEHDASTLGGNSGSSVVDFETGLVVAIHRGGDANAGNQAVPLGPLRAWALGV